MRNDNSYKRLIFYYRVQTTCSTSKRLSKMRPKNIQKCMLPFFAFYSIIPVRDLNTPSPIRKWVVAENSNLRVYGKTNINTFSCEIPSYDKKDTITIDKSAQPLILTGNIALNVKSFDCNNIIMTHDLRKTIKQDQYPELHICFISLSNIPDLTIRPAPITGQIYIEIAGVRKRFEINYQISQDGGKIIHLLGSKLINFSDFNLVPPRKLGGIIKTHDELSVEFHLKIKAIN